MLHTNQSICHYFLGDLVATERALNLAGDALNYSVGNKNPQTQTLYLRILCNYIVLYLKINHVDNIQKTINMISEFLLAEKDTAQREQLFAQVVYMLFRFDRLSLVASANLAEPDAFDDHSTHSLGINHLLTGLHHQFLGDLDRACQSLFDSYAHWNAIGDNVMCLLVLQLLKSFFDAANPNHQKIAQYMQAHLKAAELSPADFDKISDAFLLTI